MICLALKGVDPLQTRRWAVLKLCVSRPAIDQSQGWGTHCHTWDTLQLHPLSIPFLPRARNSASFTGSLHWSDTLLWLPSEIWTWLCLTAVSALQLHETAFSMDHYSAWSQPTQWLMCLLSQSMLSDISLLLIAAGSNNSQNIQWYIHLLPALGTQHNKVWNIR